MIISIFMPDISLRTSSTVGYIYLTLKWRGIFFLLLKYVKLICMDTWLDYYPFLLLFPSPVQNEKLSALVETGEPGILPTIFSCIFKYLFLWKKSVNPGDYRFFFNCFCFMLKHLYTLRTHRKKYSTSVAPLYRMNIFVSGSIGEDKYFRFFSLAYH